LRQISVLDAPSNLGLSPPIPGSVPGVYKLAWALREAGFVSRLHAVDRGVVVPPRYRPDKDGPAIRNQEAIAKYARQLAVRVTPLVRSGDLTVVLGGDCSILLGPMLALRRMGRYGLVFVDGHSDFRHPGNAGTVGPVGAAAGEDLALVTGRGTPALTGIEGLAPYVRDEDTITIGSRGDDPCRDELRANGIGLIDADECRKKGGAEIGRRVVHEMTARPALGYWIHLDADVLDPSILPAVDAPAAGGLTLEELGSLLRELVASPRAVGLDVTVFDPDMDEDGTQAQRLSDALVTALS
jgi:arginase